MPVATPPSAATPAAAEAVQPSLAEQILGFGDRAWDQLIHLDARETGINALVSAAVVLFALGAIWLLKRGIDRLMALFVAKAPGDLPEDSRAQKAAGLTWTLVRLAVLLAAGLMVMGVWGIDPWTFLSGEAGARLVRLVLIVVLVSALVEGSGFVITRLVEGFAGRSADLRRSAQLRTLAPLLRGSAQAVIIVVGLITFLSEVGLKVGPILASAGVVGIAVGFGAQTLVKDFLTGLFLVAEDVVSVGDNVRIGEGAGTVEAMTLRTIRLRDADGTLHIFPYSEAQVIHNRTKLFSSYVVEIPISYDSDVDAALAILQRIGDDLAKDPELGKLITRPCEVMGVDRLTDNAVWLKARMTTQPKWQWKVGREFNRRLKNALDDEGIFTPVKTTPVTAEPLEEQRARFDEPRAFGDGVRPPD
ncbi:MAG: mechanosensitive ion channel family protein [Phenylobacterium sp.]|uniref:mechanosensitive ion channel family protein n=1 Tax=Phenylobacterium sp. TaxID=1871053 RepID=UPI001A622EF1|nr:mechanosensitive ion channel family protein [Phenylobacterium sp.]MBL8552947.1 mechanosensitive ion channel family protein [Phenylobacterium sp.]